MRRNLGVVIRAVKPVLPVTVFFTRFRLLENGRLALGAEDHITDGEDLLSVQ